MGHKPDILLWNVSIKCWIYSSPRVTWSNPDAPFTMLHSRCIWAITFFCITCFGGVLSTRDVQLYFWRLVVFFMVFVLIPLLTSFLTAGTWTTSSRDFCRSSAIILGFFWTWSPLYDGMIFTGHPADLHFVNMLLIFSLYVLTILLLKFSEICFEQIFPEKTVSNLSEITPSQ